MLFLALLLTPPSFAAVHCPYRVALALRSTDLEKMDQLREKVLASLRAHAGFDDTPRPSPAAMDPESAAHRLIKYLNEIDRIKAQRDLSGQAAGLDLEIVDALNRDYLLKGRQGLIQSGLASLNDADERGLTAFVVRGRQFLKACQADTIHPQKPVENATDSELRWEAQAIVAELKRIPDSDMIRGVREALFTIQDRFVRQDGAVNPIWWQYALARVSMSDLEVSPLLQGWVVVEKVGGGHVAGMADFSNPLYLRVVKPDLQVETIKRQNVADIHPGVVKLDGTLLHSVMGGDQASWLRLQNRRVRLVTTYLGANQKPYAILEELGNPFKRFSRPFSEIQRPEVASGAISPQAEPIRSLVNLHQNLREISNRLGVPISSARAETIVAMIREISLLGNQRTPTGCSKIAVLKYRALRKLYPSGQRGEDHFWHDYEAGHLGLEFEQAPFSQWATPELKEFLIGESK